MQPQRDTVLGIIFPLFTEHLQRFFEDKKRVFVKFVAFSPRRLKVSSRLFFYESRKGKAIVGEARIVDIDEGTIKEIYEKYGDTLFLTWIELKEYTGSRQSKRMLALVLEDISKYRHPLRLDKSVTMAGRYMTQRMLDHLRKRTSEVIPWEPEAI